MHTLEEIKNNQHKFYDEICKFLKQEIKYTKVELTNIKTKSDYINNLKENFQKKINKFQLIPEIEKYFITEKNSHPKFYAFWDEEAKETQIFKLDNEKRP